MTLPAWAWAGSFGIFAVLMAADLMLTRNAVGLRAAATSSALWIAAALAFGGALWLFRGPATAGQYFAGYTCSSASRCSSITSTASVILKITNLTIFGVSVPVGDGCQTAPFSVILRSDRGFTVRGGGPLSGSYAIPAFRHCGLSTLPLNLTIPGPGNTLNLTLGRLRFG